MVDSILLGVASEDKDKGFSSSFILDELQLTVISCHFRTQHLFTVIFCIIDLVMQLYVISVKGSSLSAIYACMHAHKMAFQLPRARSDGTFHTIDRDAPSRSCTAARSFAARFHCVLATLGR